MQGKASHANIEADISTDQQADRDTVTEPSTTSPDRTLLRGFTHAKEAVMAKAPAPPYVGPANRHGGKGNKPIKRIVLHSTVGPTKPGSARNIAHMFNTTSRAASAHYIVDAGEVVQDLYDSYVAYHAPPNSHSLGVEICDNPGPSESRPHSVGRWADGDHRKALLLTAELVAGLCKAYGIPIRKLSPSELRAGKKGICGHIDISHAWRQTTHWDPGEFPWAEFIRLVKKAADGADIGAEVVNTGSSGGSSGGGSSYTVVSADAPLGLYDKDGKGRTRVKDWQTDALGYSDKAADGYFGSDTEDDTKALQRQLGVTADGLVGDDTLTAWKKAGSPKLEKATKPKPSKPKASKLTVDGKWGESTTRELQKILGTPIDGEVSFQPIAYESQNPGLLSGWEWTKHPRSSNVIEALQRKLGVSDDGRIGPDTIKALQRKLGTGVDGVVSNPSAMVKQLQRNLNAGKLG